MAGSNGAGLAAPRESIFSGLRNFIFGRPLATSVHLEHRLPILLALPVFASDAMSSVAYATEEILIQFTHAGLGAESFKYLIPISIAIVILILIVGASYRQAISLYPSGGGSYAVSRENLGTFASVLAAAALTVDYILTVAVSVSSGVQYLLALPIHPPATTTLPFSTITVPTAVIIALTLIWFIAYMNLRGTRESGFAFAFPAYTFSALLLVMFGATIWHFIAHPGFVPTTAQVAHQHNALAGVGLLLILRAFSSGCAALTGVETVATGVTAFEPPETKNAAKTLMILIATMIVLFTGVSLSALHFGVLPGAHGSEPVISQIAAHTFGNNIMQQPSAVLFWAINLITMLLLMIAANGSFAGLPRLLALVAKDGYAPKAFVSLGDRLVHNRGIIMLAVASSLLIIAFQATTTKLIPLYAVGVFICFTLTQIGMVTKLRRERQAGWQRMLVVAAVGAVVTGGVAIVQAVSKFTEGSWMVVVILPVLILCSYAIRRHYDWFDKIMTVGPADHNPLAEASEPLTVLVLVSSDIHRGTLEGLEAGRAIAEQSSRSVLRAVHIELDPEKTPRLRNKWQQLVAPYLGHQIALDVVPSPYRWLIDPLMEYIDHVDLERGGDRVIIVVPEFETGSWITQLLHNFTAHRVRAALMSRPNITVVNSRYFMRPMAWRKGRGGLVY